MIYTILYQLISPSTYDFEKGTDSLSMPFRYK